MNRSALDPITRVALQDKLRQIHRELALTSILVTHDMGEALVLADPIAVIILDALLGATEHALASRTRRRAAIPVGLFAGLIVIVIAVLPRVVGSQQQTAAAAVSSTQAATDLTHVRIGGKTFTEQYILVALLRARLEQIGVTADLAPSLGSTVIFDALVHVDVDVYVDYSGTLWTNVMKCDAGPPRWRVVAELEGWLAREYGVRSLGALGFENTYALAVQRTYGLRFAHTTSYDPALLYDAVAGARST